MKHVILENPDYSEWEPDSGYGYEHLTCSDKPGALYRLYELEQGFGTVHEWRKDANETLAKCATLREKKLALDEWSMEDIINSDGGGSVYDSETWRAMRGDFEETYPDNCKGAIYSRLDPHNAYSPDGEKVGSLCHCEDYPCCGH